MSTALTLNENPTSLNQNMRQYVTVFVGKQIFGIPVLVVQDVLRPQPMARIPLARGEIAGLLNLRGRIVTAINLAGRLRLDHDKELNQQLNVVVDYKGELYSLLVDRVGDVMTLPIESFEKNPANLECNLSDISSGVYKLQRELLVVLDVEKLLKFN